MSDMTTAETPVTNPVDTKGIPPTVRPEAEPYWEGARRGVLMIEHCPKCDLHTFPPIGWCRRCRSFEIEQVEHTGPGRLASYTINRVAWLDGMQVPFALGLVEFDDMPGVRIPSRLRVPFEDLAMDMLLE